MKATHNGTCQRCGRQQAIKDGVLVNHGYTVDYGWFQGICAGTNERPLEVNKDLATDTVIYCGVEAEKLEAITAADITTLIVEVVDTTKTRKTRKKVKMTIAEYIEYCATDTAYHCTVKQKVTGEVNRAHHRARGLRAHAVMIAALIENTYGQPLVCRGAVTTLKERHEFAEYKTAEVKIAELKAAGFRVRRTGHWTTGFVVTATKAA
jgi:hypothetical protein